MDSAKSSCLELLTDTAEKSTKVIGSMTNSKDTDDIFLLVVQRIQANGNQGLCMVWEKLFMLMEQVTRVNGKMVTNTVRVLLLMERILNGQESIRTAVSSQGFRKN